MKKTKREKKNKPASQELVIPDRWLKAVSKLVGYYDEGWYYGYLQSFTKGGYARIQPIGALGGKIPHTKIIPLTSLKLVEEKTETDFE